MLCFSYHLYHTHAFAPASSSLTNHPSKKKNQQQQHPHPFRRRKRCWSTFNNINNNDNQSSSAAATAFPSGFNGTHVNGGGGELPSTSTTNANNSNGNGNSLVNNSVAAQAQAGAEAAPREVDNWTTLMTDGTNAAIHRPCYTDEGSTLEDARSIVLEGIDRTLKEEDYEKIEEYWDESLLPHVNYLGSEAAMKVKKALEVAYYAHNGQKRKSGEPFIIHPVEVAKLLAGLKMDGETVQAGLLHDTVEDTELTFDQVEALFGKTVLSIVEGETKVSKLPKLALTEYADEQAENLRQMFVAMTDDYRIIIVKLADRLHNMRTLRHMKPAKQIKISRETLDIFAPLAHRMGIWQFKAELEDTAFLYLYPEEYKELHRRLRLYQTRFRDALEKSQEILEETLRKDPTLREQDISITVSGRTKDLYSLWHKMNTKQDNDLNHIADVVALRIILDKKEKNGEQVASDFGNASSINNNENDDDDCVWLCYHVLGIVQNKLPHCQPVPTRVKDYISFPKPNGYQSLHTAIIHNGSGQMIEVQIRTAAMHRVAEYGMASHWAYKMNTMSSLPMEKSSVYVTPWLASIKEYERDELCSRDFVECVRRELLGKRVFVFLRNGKILNLAKGATVIDAAFQIHTEVGLGMIGALINGRRVPVSYELKNGDVVNILTESDEETGEAKLAKPQYDWMRYAKVRSTRSKLRSYFRAKQRESFREAGSFVVNDFLAAHYNVLNKCSYLDSKPIPIQLSDEMLEPVHPHYNCLDDLLIDIGKRHDRDLLRSVMSKILKVPLSVIQDVDGGYISQAGRKQRRKAASIGLGANIDGIEKASEDYDEEEEDIVSYNYDMNCDNVSDNPDANDRANGDNDRMVNDDECEVTDMMMLLSSNHQVVDVDTDDMCPTCLPVAGDDVIGVYSNDGIGGKLTVHRPGCIHSNRALNEAAASTSGDVSDVVGEKTIVNLSWPQKQNIVPSDDSKCSKSYIVELNVFANDRKLLLADCSEVVSEFSDIVKTGSLTTNEHARLDFLVKVEDINQLQVLMDNLQNIHSVMNVERRFGSNLMQ